MWGSGAGGGQLPKGFPEMPQGIPGLPKDLPQLPRGPIQPQSSMEQFLMKNNNKDCQHNFIKSSVSLKREVTF